MKLSALLVPALHLVLSTATVEARPRGAASEPAKAESALDVVLRNAESALERKDAAGARPWVEKALERDAKSVHAWELRASCASALGDRDLELYSLHQALRLAVAQKRPQPELDLLRERVIALDPMAKDLLGLSKIFTTKLQAVAEQYEKDKRPHSAIAVYKEILALDPESKSSTDSIQRLASAPDPSLAGDAKPKDLLEGISEEWIRERDAQHVEWKEKEKLERDHYVTYTNSGYANLVRAGEAMEQMNAFYREFFQFGTETDGRAVPRIELRIFRKRDEYLKFGSSPVEWSGGQFTGAAVETYVGDGSFNDMVGTLFHEAAHQFVSLATNASGWLNEGLASFFEGCRILSNGTVIMNLPANHRLFPMVERLKQGWMQDHEDGIDKSAPSKSSPKKAPTFGIVLENKYEWGPPWYAPTWAVVYFLYNYQDPTDGRYVYRAAFREFINKSGGRAGEGAIKNFEEVVLANPQPPIKGVPRPKDARDVILPKTVLELDPVWKDWLIGLAKEQNGEIQVPRPYLQWARYALKNKDESVAREHFEKALIAAPQDPDTLLEFAAFLSERKGQDRAAKLVLEAVRVLEERSPPDDKAIAAAERQLERFDPKRRALETVHKELWSAARGLVERYRAGDRPMMVMDLAWRMGTDLRVPGLFELYAEALRTSGRSLGLWSLAYDEKSLEGWAVPGDSAFTPDGETLKVKYKDYSASEFDFQMMALDVVTSGDYSLEAEIAAEPGKTAFGGLLFGRKDANNFHALMLFPGRASSGERAGLAESGFVDLASSFGGGVFKTWRHSPVKTKVEVEDTATRAETWHKLRIDVAGAVVDCWFDDALLATQEFPSADVLRGNFGLITGRGVAKFANVRHQIRPARDPAARVERTVRMEKLEASGEPVGGSYVGRVPPFPEVAKWVQGTRKDWREKGPVPQLLVLWSIAQNDLVPIDGWLADLATRHAKIGLEIVAIASPNDLEKAAAYLERHPLPGAVGIDKREKEGIGDTFTRYSVDRFNLPRLLLIDVDGKVVWEGDPGFRSGDPWAAGTGSFLDTPLEELIARRSLEALAVWAPKWKETGAPALARGDLATALPLLREAQAFPTGRGIPALDEARAKLAAIELALDAPTTTAATFERDGVLGALPALLAYAPVVKKTIDKNTQIALKAVLEGPAARPWNDAVRHCDRIRARAKKEEKLALASELVAKLATQEGHFEKALLADLAPAVEQGDTAKIQELVTTAKDRPAQWLITEYLRW